MSAERKYSEVVITREVVPGVVEVKKATFKRGRRGEMKPVQEHSWQVSPVHGTVVEKVPAGV